MRARCVGEMLVTSIMPSCVNAKKEIKSGSVPESDRRGMAAWDGELINADVVWLMSEEAALQKGVSVCPFHR